MSEKEDNNINEKDNNNKKETPKGKEIKMGFFKKVKYSIFKIEKYGEMSAEGFPRAMMYLFKLALIVAIVTSMGILYQIDKIVTKGVSFIEEQVGDFTYKNGTLQIEEGKVVRAPSSKFGEVIIDTGEKTEEQINEYLNSMQENQGILLLKDRAIFRGLAGTGGNVSYEYKKLAQNMDKLEVNKEQIINYTTGGEKLKAYAGIFIVMLGYSIISTLLPILFNVFLLSIFGYLVTWMVKIKMRFVAVFNIAAYSLTLSVLLNALLIGVNIFTTFQVKYFQIMYVAVAAIYEIAAIMLIKSDFIKQQKEKENNGEEPYVAFKERDEEI